MVKGMRILVFAVGVLLVNLTIQSSATNYSLNLVAQGPGTVSRNPTNSTYPQGVVVTITAAPNTGAYFAGWSGDVNSSANPLNVNITGNLSITGSFLPFPVYTVSLATNGQGTIALNPGASSYYSNSTVTATATPAAGWVFAGWSGALTGIVNPSAITVDSNESITGSFGQIPTFALEPQGVTNSSGSTVSITSQVTGTGPLNYQWYFAGSSDSGATNASLAIADAGTASSGQYWLVASSPYGSVTSSIISLLITNSSGSTNIISVCDESGLRAAVAIGGWITIGCNGTITLSSPIDITNNVILDGANVSATISGGGVTRLFNVATNSSLSITNVSLADGTVLITTNTSGINADGGAIYNNGGSVSLTSCTLSNNSAQALLNGGTARGGVLFNAGGQVYIGSSLVVSNYIISGIGPNSGIYASSESAATSLGGAFCNEGGSMTLAADSVLNNSLSAQISLGNIGIAGGIGLGGALFTSNGYLMLVDCIVSNNVCSAQAGQAGPQCYGGAIDQASGSLCITNSLIVSNSAVGGGGGGGGFGSGYPPLAAYGGGIAAAGGNVSLDHVAVTGNTSQSGGTGYHTSSSPSSGGGIYNHATLIAEYCTINGNKALVPSETITVPASGSGGAIYNLGNVTLDHSAVYSNLVQGSYGFYSIEGAQASGGNSFGGGIYNSGQFAATNSTIALNIALSGNGGSSENIDNQPVQTANGEAFGGGVYNDAGGVFDSWNVTIASNFVVAVSNAQYSLQGLPGQAAGAQIYNHGTQLSLHNSILAYGGSSSNASGTITDDGYNISSDGSANFESGSSFNFTDPVLAPLANNGGRTLTMALLPNSPAVDSADSANAPTTDQRGYARPAGAGFDIGAFEFGTVPAQTSTGLSLLATTNKYNLSFSANTGLTYILETSTNLKTWTPWLTNGPFTSPTNISQPVNPTNANSRYFRLLIQ